MKEKYEQYYLLMKYTYISLDVIEKISDNYIEYLSKTLKNKLNIEYLSKTLKK